jgi:hypothetical protein
MGWWIALGSIMVVVGVVVYINIMETWFHGS